MLTGITDINTKIFYSGYKLAPQDIFRARFENLFVTKLHCDIILYNMLLNINK